MNLRKGHNYSAVFADLMTNRVLFATPGEDSAVWEASAAEMLRHNGHPNAMQYVAINMSSAYPKGVCDNLWNAWVVCDKFPVIQNVVEAFDHVRKADNRAMPRQRREGGPVGANPVDAGQ
jgi:transposase